jgi:hypothetical protein
MVNKAKPRFFQGTKKGGTALWLQQRAVPPFSFVLLFSFHPQMALLRNLCVNLRDGLCGVPAYASAPSLDFPDLTQKFSFLDWKPDSVQN